MHCQWSRDPDIDQEELLRAPMVESRTWKLSTAKLWLPRLASCKMVLKPVNKVPLDCSLESKVKLPPQPHFLAILPFIVLM